MFPFHFIRFSAQTTLPIMRFSLHKKSMSHLQYTVGTNYVNSNACWCKKMCAKKIVCIQKHTWIFLNCALLK